MAVINSTCDLRVGHGPCMLCGEGLLYPYLEWRAEKENGKGIVICGRCCQKIKKGFMADLIQIAAGMELRDLHMNGFRDLLIRESMDHLTNRQLAEYEQCEGTDAANKV